MRGRSWAWMVLLLGFLPAAAMAQEVAGIVGTGMAQVKKQPDALRMAVELQVDGADLKDAMARLKERRAAIIPALLKLGAADKSIEFNMVRRLDSGGSDQRSAMTRMIRERMNGLKTTPATGPSAPPALPVTVAITVQAEWPLPQSGPEDLLVASSTLQEKIRAARLFDPQKIERPKTEEEEEREGLEQTGGYERPQPRPGEPMFYYIARISPEERAKAMAEAFQKARKNAEALAKAAAVGVGELKLLSTSVGSVRNGFEGGYGGGFGGYEDPESRMFAMLARARGENPELGETEAISSQPGLVSYAVAVTASFAINGGPHADGR